MDVPTRTRQSWPRAGAPGKVFLAGEYGVLFGGSALVMAVDRRVTVGGDAGRRDAADPLIRAVLNVASKELGLELEEPPAIDATDFLGVDGSKLGLGSSAAKAAAVMAAAFSLADRDIGQEQGRRRLLEATRRAHHRAGGGSGADVAASVMGGVISYRLSDMEPGARPDAASALSNEVRAVSVDLPPNHLPIVVHGGRSVSTRTALERLRAGIEAGDGRHLSLVQSAVSAGDILADVLISARSYRQVTSAVTEASRVLLDLAASVGLEHDEEAMRSVSAIASGFGGAVKPSGAGAGDLILVFVPSIPPEERATVTAHLDRAGHNVLNLAPSHEGACVHGPSSPPGAARSSRQAS